jgi:hypothetical protein
MGATRTTTKTVLDTSLQKKNQFRALTCHVAKPKFCNVPRQPVGILKSKRANVCMYAFTRVLSPARVVGRHKNGCATVCDNVVVVVWRPLQCTTFAAGGTLHRAVSAMYFRCAIFGGSDPTDQRGCGISTIDSASVTFLKNSWESNRIESNLLSKPKRRLAHQKGRLDATHAEQTNRQQ